jgi:hypothetical protein
MNEFTKGQLIELCQMVYRGCKPLAVMSVKKIYESEVIKLIDSEGVKSLIREMNDENWVEICIFKRDEMRFIIDYLPDNPTTEFEHFILGCAFGYSIDAICDFIGRVGREKL